mgnify:FL=1
MSEIQILPIDPSIAPKTTEVAEKAFGTFVRLMIPKKNLWGF